MFDLCELAEAGVGSDTFEPIPCGSALDGLLTFDALLPAPCGVC